MADRFYEFGLCDELLSSLADMGFEEPTQIQKISIPPALEGRDLIGVAQTGTGKTASFGIPMVEKGARGSAKAPAALVLVPTRELAIQVAQEMNKLGMRSGFRTMPIYGGQSIERQIKGLKTGVDLVVGTPGRVIDHIRRRTLILSGVATVVLDEADEMLNMGFIDDMETILKETPGGRQTMLFSATMPSEIVKISKRYMNDPKKVKVDTKELVVAKIDQVFFEVRHTDKLKALRRILDVQDPALTIIFCHTKKEVDALASSLVETGYSAGAIHGDFTQSARDDMMRRFKGGELDMLVATDVAARGLDIKDVSHVINYSIPQNPDAYVHRIGRTGRAGKFGIAITFVTPREYSQLRLIERVAKTKINKGKLPTQEEVAGVRQKELREELVTIMGGNKHKDFYPLVEELLEEFYPEDIAAAAVYLAAGDMRVEHIEEGRGKDQRSPGAGPMARLFLTIGKKDKVKVGDMVRVISEKARISGQQIGNIALFDKFSFVEVPVDMAEQVIASVNDMKIGGKKVRVQAAKDSKKGGKGGNQKGKKKKR